MAGNNIPFGRRGETDAANYAVEHGYTLVDRNYYTPYGEIDLVLRDPEGRWVFTEVKSRTQLRYGYPEESITPTKLKHMLRSEEYYLYEHKLYDEPRQLDVMSLLYASDRQTLLEVKWFRDVTREL